MKTRRPGKKQQRKGTAEEKDVDPESARENSDDSDGGEFVLPEEEGEESEDDTYAEEGKTKQTKKQAVAAVDDQEARTQY